MLIRCDKYQAFFSAVIVLVVAVFVVLVDVIYFFNTVVECIGTLKTSYSSLKRNDVKYLDDIE